MNMTAEFLPKAATGISGLDDILVGGLARNRLHLLEGSPGTGKTTIALQFLMAGVEQGAHHSTQHPPAPMRRQYAGEG